MSTNLCWLASWVCLFKSFFLITFFDLVRNWKRFKRRNNFCTNNNPQNEHMLQEQNKGTHFQSHTQTLRSYKRV